MKKWMKNIPDTVNIADINVPGTHDSCAEHVILKHFTKCQNLGIKEQLEAGIRLFDMRMELCADGRVKAVHSIIDCRKRAFSREKLYYEDIFSDIFSFLEENPTETVIILLKRDDGAPADVTFDAFCDRYIKDDDRFFTENRLPLLGEVRGKTVLINRCEISGKHTDLTAGINFSQWHTGIPGTESFVYSAIPLRNGENGKYGYYIQDFFKTKPTEKWSKAVLPLLNDTPQEKECIVLNYFSANDGIHSPANQAKYMFGKFSGYALKKGRKYGWLIFDYPSAEVISKTVNSN